MNEARADASALLNELCAAAEAQRAELLRAAGPVEDSLYALAEEVERLAMTRVARALLASEIMLALADALGGARERARTRRARAQSLSYAGRFDEALPWGAEAVQIALDADLPVELGWAQLALVHALMGLARYDEARVTVQAARRTFVRAGEFLAAARADASVGGICQKMDDPEAALRHFDRARRLLKDEPVALAQLEANRGLALLSLDDFGGAERAYRAALAAFTQADMAWAAAIVENNLAVLATRQGRLHQALHYFELARRHLDTDAAPAELARVLVEQADALVILGLLSQALHQYKIALPILQKHGQALETAQAQAGIGAALARLGQTDEAERRLRDAVDEFGRLGQAAAQARLNLLRAELALARDDAVLGQRLAAGALERLQDRPAEACAARYQLSRAARAAGDFAVAQAALAKAIPDATALDIAPLLADLLHARGLLHRDDRAHEAALADFRAAVEQVERIRGALQAERFRAAFHGRRLGLYHDLVTTALDAGDGAGVAEAFETVERAKSRALLDMLEGAIDTVEMDVSGEHDPATAALLAELSRQRAELNALYSRLADAQFAAAPERGTSRWRAQIHKHEQQIEALENRLSATRGIVGLYARPVQLREVQARLAPATALVEYFIADDELMAFVLRAEDVHIFRGLCTLAELTEHSERLQFQLRRALRPAQSAARRTQRRGEDAQRALGALHKLLLAPLQGALGGCEGIAFVPHGLVHALPLHALWDGTRYLIQQCPIAYAASAGLFVQSTKAPPTAAPAARPLVIGVADQHAPQIEAEARCVAQTLETDCLLLRGGATTDKVKAAISSAGIVHFACHGHFSAEHPLASGLRLADRWLTVREIYDLRLSGQLVTLSGCETGRNLITAGDELQGLVRAFLAAGAASLLVSLWTVHDESTSNLMLQFYNVLKAERADRGVASALRTAQLEIMQARPHPAHWAPFILVGGI